MVRKFWTTCPQMTRSRVSRLKMVDCRKHHHHHHHHLKYQPINDVKRSKKTHMSFKQMRWWFYYDVITHFGTTPGSQNGTRQCYLKVTQLHPPNCLSILDREYKNLKSDLISSVKIPNFSRFHPRQCEDIVLLMPSAELTCVHYSEIK